MKFMPIDTNKLTTSS